MLNIFFKNDLKDRWLRKVRDVSDMVFDVGVLVLHLTKSWIWLEKEPNPSGLSYL